MFRQLRILRPYRRLYTALYALSLLLGLFLLGAHLVGLPDARSIPLWRIMVLFAVEIPVGGLLVLGMWWKD